MENEMTAHGATIQEALSWLESIEQTGRAHDPGHPAFIAWARAGYPQNYPSWVARQVAGKLRAAQPKGDAK